MIGTNVTSSQFKNFVKNMKNESGENVWKSSYNAYVEPLTASYNLEAGRIDRTENILQRDYSEAITKAYETSVANKRAAEFSAYGAGDKLQINEAYQKAYDESRRAYKEAYTENLEKLQDSKSELTYNYLNSVNEFANALNSQQEEIAQGYADFFNSYYDYLSSLYSQYSEDEMFAEGSYLSQFVVNVNGENQLMTSDRLLQKLSREENGERFLTEDALAYMRALNSISTLYEGIESHERYLYDKSPATYEFLNTYGDQFYTDMGFKDRFDAYGTDAIVNYMPANSYNLSTAKGFEVVKNKSNVDVKLDDNTIMLQRDTEVPDGALSGALNRLAGGSPSDDNVVIYKDDVYIYQKNKWYKLKDRDGRDKVSTLVDSYKEREGISAATSELIKVTGAPSNKITNFQVIIDGVEYGLNEHVTDDVMTYLNSRYGQYKNDEIVVKYKDKYYYKTKNGTKAWRELIGYQPS